ncbi:HEAT repeat domain-containing protein [Nodosilinea sp. LEGE 07088]|uniref:HEAT repeat domain-containing protein n=1 Tax=Nodosilinea sp. LEGE 07088 TaxID=2777968 RepID=UPI001880D3DB|nr:HEAT repeat domain-containing protein [Nodosilinea sp. LEGE 07088]MBE9139973.1 HEAT repeat domain-containing protein [Nodosilinea sp. LEGE 07088]
MTNFTIGPDNSGLSPTLLQAISATSLEVELDLPRLAAQDLADLKAILKGEKRTNVPISTKRALNALVRSERSPETRAITASILSDSRQPNRVRSLAALNLSLMPAPETERALIQNLQEANTQLQASVVRSLGRIGTVQAFEQLQRLDTASELVRRQVAFAKQTIAYRSDSSAPDLQAERTRLPLAQRDQLSAPARSTTGWATFSAKPVTGHPVQEKVRNIWGSTYGLTLNQTLGLEVDCGTAQHFLFLHERLQQGRFLAGLRSRPSIIGLLAPEPEPEQHVTIRYVLLANPSDQGLALAVTRTNGDLVYGGDGTLTRAGLRFTLRDVGPTLTPTEIVGQVSDDEIQLTLRIGPENSRPKRHGVAI